jgi:hypothetical protein
MRRRVVIAALVSGIAATAAWFLVGERVAGPRDVQAPPGVDQIADDGPINPLADATIAPETPLQPKSPTIPVTEGTTGSNDAMAETQEAEQEAYVAKRVVELQDLGMENDSASLDMILSELDNRDPTIRQAAVDAAVQFGSRDAIPRLMNAAAQTDDPEEKSAILEAIEFLKLPTLTEALGQGNQSAPAASSGTHIEP